MKKLFVVAIMALVLLGGVTAGIGFMAGRKTAVEDTVTEPTDMELVRQMIFEEHGEGDYEIVIMEDQGDGYIDYFVFDENGESVTCGWTNREVRLQHWNETH